MDGGGSHGRGVGTRSVELVVAALFFLFGCVVIYDSFRLGRGWADEGPQAGYFPFYLGAIICVSALVTIFQALTSASMKKKVFVENEQLWLVMKVFVPTLVYVGRIGVLGIYVSSIAFIGFFMRWLGDYAWSKVVLVPVCVIAVFFVVFEMWFKVPLPKGPLESLLGLD